jgi:hypothetical protein
MTMSEPLPLLKRIPPLGIGGCDFAADPSKSAGEAKVAWNPDIDPGVVVLSSLPSLWQSSEPSLDAASRQTPDNAHRMLGNEPPHDVIVLDNQLPGTPLGAIVALDEALPMRLAATLALWRSMKGDERELPPEITPQRRQRLILGLRALDGTVEGQSQREIARGLFGASRVPTGPAWKSHHLRSRIIRLLTDARALRDGGYRSLLRSGRTVRF